MLKRHLAVKEEGTLLSVPFVTVNEYLWLLKGVSEELRVMGREGLWYLAAAVSDFFLPGGRMVSSRTHLCSGLLSFDRPQPDSTLLSRLI